MAKISFYLIEKKPQSPIQIAVRLCKQIYLKHKIWLYCDDDATMQQLDDLLWQDDDATRFIAHGIDQFEAPICISMQKPQLGFDVCINLTENIFQFNALSQSDLHLIEIVANDEPAKIIGRERYKHYRQTNVEPQVYRL
ncbi:MULTISPECIES: DNA polymerase III subunit chi [unclassified Acinetobacter]|uniref:DNA polymerase III subunit chi n=1 Tax=unclassified Acinetobacter TaxID=196816 RepID=UPI0035B6D3FD